MPVGTIENSISAKRYRREAGQASILVVVMLSLFLLAVLAFAVDYTNIWFQRQQAQTAADAACEAGAMDLYEMASGVTLPNAGFVAGTAGNCNAYGSAGPTMCWYANKNGFNGYTSGPATVSWTFPATVSGVTAPPSSVAEYPFLQVSVSLPVKTYFSTLITNSQTQQVGALSTCGLTEVMEGAPIMVLNPTISGALSYSGGSVLKIVGGPPRSIVVNSSSSTAIQCSPSGLIDTSKGGPNQTGADVGTYGGPKTAPNSSSCPGSPAFSPGTTGHWDWPASPVPDPYSAVPAPTNMKSVTPGIQAWHMQNHGTNYTCNLTPPEMDGCPDENPDNYGSYNDADWWSCDPRYNNTTKYPWYCKGCVEYSPGYYPNGIDPTANCAQGTGDSVVIFLPGVYYLDGPLNIGGSQTMRVAKPCANSQGVVNANQYYNSGNCSPYTYTAGPNGVGGGTPWTWHQTDGVMFFFHGSGYMNITGAAGSSSSSSRSDHVPVTDLTCDGSTPPAYLNLASSLTGNVMEAPCTSKGTYWDAYGDTSDSLGSIRGLLMFQDHSNTASPQLVGSGAISFTGTFYFHSSSYGTVFQLTGAASTGTLIWGNVVTDQLHLSGSPSLSMALNPSNSAPILKVGLLQ
jgi:hypothetical protein